MRALTVSLVLLTGCTATVGGTDAGEDSGTQRPDSGTSDAGSTDAGLPLPDPCTAAGTCDAGVWVDVTPAGTNTSDFGNGAVVVDPARPSHLYFGGYDDGVWRSTDYGNTWERRDTTIDGSPDSVPSVAQGVVLGVAGTLPEATVYVAKGCACGRLLKSTDGGRTWRTTGSGLPADTDFYSFVIDPNDPTHLLSGLHEADGIVESFDSGETWHVVGMGGTGGFPTGGVSWFPFFFDAGDAATTRRTWFAIAQGGGSPVVTRDSGASWTIPAGLMGLQHPHGSSQTFQSGSTFFVAGQGGLFRSTDSLATFTQIRDGNFGTIWGSSSKLYGAWGWACGRACMAGPDMVTSPFPGDAWTSLPTTIPTGTHRVAVTSDGRHTIYVASMWWAGIWRFVEAP